MLKDLFTVTLSRAELRQFGFIMAAGIALIFGLLIPWLKGSGIILLHYPLAWPLPWPWSAAIVLLVVSIFAPLGLTPIYKIWMKIGLVLGYINTRLILGLIYMALFAPMAMMLKLLGKDPMRRALSAEELSYRVESNQPKPENLNRPY